jgi:hypothetical protein
VEYNAAARISSFGSCLNWLSIEECEDEHDMVTTMATIVEGCPLIQSLDLSHYNTVGDISIIMIAEAYPNLKSLDLSDPNLSRNRFRHFSRTDDDITDVGIIRLADGCPNLQRLQDY